MSEFRCTCPRRLRRVGARSLLLPLPALFCCRRGPAGDGGAAEPTISLARLEELLAASPLGPSPAPSRPSSKATTIVDIPCTILGIVPQAARDNGPLIIFQASGPVIDEAGGIAAGMSGSPVYVNDGGRTGSWAPSPTAPYFTSNGLGLATPIERMTALEDLTWRPACRQAARRRSACADQHRRRRRLLDPWSSPQPRARRARRYGPPGHARDAPTRPAPGRRDPADSRPASRTSRAAWPTGASRSCRLERRREQQPAFETRARSRRLGGRPAHARRPLLRRHGHGDLHHGRRPPGRLRPSVGSGTVPRTVHDQRRGHRRSGPAPRAVQVWLPGRCAAPSRATGAGIAGLIGDTAGGRALRRAP